MTRILVVDNYDSFVFTIVGYLEQLGADCDGRAQRRRRRGRRRGLRRRARLTRPGHARGGRGLDGDDRGLRASGPSRCSACASATRPSASSSARPSAARPSCCTARPRRSHHDGTGVLDGLPTPVHRDPLPLADHRPRDPAGRAGRQRAHRLRHRHGGAPPRPAAARRAVPPRERADRGRPPDARQLAGAVRRCRRRRPLGRASARWSTRLVDARGLTRRSGPRRRGRRLPCAAGVGRRGRSSSVGGVVGGTVTVTVVVDGGAVGRRGDLDGDGGADLDDGRRRSGRGPSPRRSWRRRPADLRGLRPAFCRAPRRGPSLGPRGSGT